jgi:hypothetical protein
MTACGLGSTRTATLVPGLRDRRLIRHSSNSLADQAKVRRAGSGSKIGGNQIIRTPCVYPKPYPSLVSEESAKLAR